MKIFFRVVVLYLVVTVIVMVMTRPVTSELLFEAIAATITFFTLFSRASMWLLPLFAGVVVMVGWRRFLAGAHLIGYAVFGSVLLQVAFSFLKCTIPLIVPFYADPPLADFDKWLHGGVDPWIYVHDWAKALPIHELLPAYLVVWAVPAIAMALIITVSDRDAERTARFIVLYVTCWFVLGNVLAVAGSSVGPVFYDALLGGDRFAALHTALEESGVKDTRIGLVQHYLWAGYAEQGIAFGSGISAFPSVHVGIATITALYLAERNRWLAIPGFAFLAIILLLSVYTGYHYAVDGYFSILFIFGLWAVLRRMRLTEASIPFFGLLAKRDGPAQRTA
ncbi:hypothetical protein DEA8626_02444 [Defluviimonas aquaemixtae]|uniref:Inositolphosphotransferase Aur1/Ipt1 domain-containing protein n=1 Tax=Albidovulum aquaemixtae TaxID=1542388 RepID=A0A2R8BJA9_9RHOB|nr:phosphatase PAP2 family protein [Defluviimonas aquaemixtae]SPH23380.1 hypothetical protein DEA8626_02444 [Defluviimonas aquaemixtae]